MFLDVSISFKSFEIAEETVFETTRLEQSMLFKSKFLVDVYFKTLNLQKWSLEHFSLPSSSISKQVLCFHHRHL